MVLVSRLPFGYARLDKQLAQAISTFVRNGAVAGPNGFVSTRFSMALTTYETACL